MSEEGKATTLKVPVGIVGLGMSEVVRAVGPDEPPAWPPNAELAVVGRRTPAVDGRLKVTGAAVYTADVRLPGMLHARVVRSPHPHARIRSIDTSIADRHPGVRATHVLNHIRDGAELRDKSGEEPSRWPVVRYEGQPVAAVAAITEADAEEAVRLVRVDWDVQPFVVDLEDARAVTAPVVFPGPAEMARVTGGGRGPSKVAQAGNVRGPVEGGPFGPPRGNVVAGFAASDVIVEGTFRTAVQTHSALETHGVVADWKTDGLTVHASTQGTSTVRDELAEVFGLQKSNVRVLTAFMGGGFGAKFGAGNYGVLAVHLSKKARAPVRLMHDRREEHLAGGNRPSSVQHLRVGAKKDGTLMAIHLSSYGSAGVGTGAGTAGPAKNMYPCPNLLTEETDVFTHAGAAAAFRAPGHPQGCFALEQIIDELAERLSLDPIALRDKIDVDEGENSKNLDSALRKEERRQGAVKMGWSSRHAPGAGGGGSLKRGMGMAQAIWYRFIDLDASCEVRVTRDGSVEILSAVQDIGTGIRTALAQVVGEELGLSASLVTVKLGDTFYPQGPPSGGSKTTGSITPAARNAAFRVRRQILEQVAPHMGVAASELEMKDGKVRVVRDPARSLTFRAAVSRLKTEQIASRAGRSEDYGGFQAGRGSGRVGVGGYGGVQFAAVAVDVETGVIKVERVVAVHDCGRPINPLALESQINGGVLQGVSYALYENRVLDKNTGLMLNANLDMYKILGARETPTIEIVLLEEYRGRNSTDAGGIGEPSTIPTAAAVANAVYNAIGVRMRELPMTPARVLEALAKKGRAT